MRMESTSIFKEYVEHLSEDECNLFQDEFNTYDKTGNGFITIKVALTHLHAFHSPKRARLTLD